MLLPRPTLARLTKHHPISSSRSHPRVAIQPHHHTRLAAVAFDPDAYELEDDEELDEDDFEDFTGALDEERQGQLHNAGEATTSSQQVLELVYLHMCVLHPPPQQTHACLQLFRSLSNPLRELPRVTSEAVTATSSAAANVAGELLQEASQHVTATAQQLAQRARTAQPGKTLKRISSKVESKIGELPEVMFFWCSSCTHAQGTFQPPKSPGFLGQGHVALGVTAHPAHTCGCWGGQPGHQAPRTPRAHRHPVQLARSAGHSPHVGTPAAGFHHGAA